jgi:hypothetical protein
MRARWIVAIVLFVGAFVLLTGLLVLAILAGQAERTAPQITFQTPRLGESVRLGSTTLVHAVARDPDGVVHADLWVDGVLVAEKESALPGGSTPLPILTDWSPDESGPHTLIVRAVDSQGVEGQAQVVVEVANGVDPAVYRIGEGADVLSDEALADLALDHPDLAQAVEAGGLGLVPASSSEDSEDRPAPPAPPEEGGGGPTLSAPGVSGAFLALGRLLGGWLNPAEGWLEVEGLTLETDAAYANLYCYVRLGDAPVERIPAEGSLGTAGERYWDIALYTAGENKRVVPIPASGALSVMVNCAASGEALGDTPMLLIDLGVLNTRHLAADWDGRELEHRVTGDRGRGWFRIVYRITRGGGGDGECPSPGGLTYACSENRFINAIFCELRWSYPEDRMDDITGYTILRDGAYTYVVEDPHQTWTLVSEGDGVPPCGITYVYRVVAYRGNTTDPANVSAPSNPIVLRGQLCETRPVRVRFVSLEAWGLYGDCPPDLPCTGLWTDGDCAEDGYGLLWANEQLIHIGGTNDIHLLYDLECFEPFYFPEVSWSYGEPNPIGLMLRQADSLEIGFRWMDYDSGSSHDLECQGSILLTNEELDRIVGLPDHSEGYRLETEVGPSPCRVDLEVWVGSGVREVEVFHPEP